jgi:RNA polymerase sigma-70 factor (sigma-E family)
LAYALTGSAHEAEDLVQGALVKVMRRWRRVDDPMAYLRRVMINHRTSVWRRFGAREVVTAIPPDRAVGDTTHTVDDRHVVLAALRLLPPRMRAVVALRYVADLSEADTAAALDCSVGTVKSQTSKALARLRETLEPTHCEAHTWRTP